ncbi:sensor histidine kinase [Solimicrobium silvestre]|uniref:histidine kinase n=1 Tax=Solimicrobium silvestre TaxID=2099400 RepID=A0A2S9H4R4_9BURK|nr:ATP-binding protein [Solimicrobium silvestre]PRC94958.1 Histidine kinase-, DNA gyrase B-, and HSP90-like ATPase [Solimicrobium silvestre]
MAFKFGIPTRFRITVYVITLMGLAAFAAQNSHAPRLIVTCGLLALLITEMLRRALHTLERQSQRPAQEIAVAIPLHQQTLAANLLTLEAHLEHAPIALFCGSQSAGNELVTPLNTYARRLIAPGRVSNLPSFYAKLAASDNGQRNIINFDTERGQERALVSINNIHIHGAAQRLIAILPIESELETVAFNAWQQLVHVLTHEIMNSLTPVASLSRTAHDLLAEMREKIGATIAEKTHAELIDAQEIGNDLSTALDAISRRSDSLVGFVSNYRSLTNVPTAAPERVRIQQLFSRLAALVDPAWQAGGGKATFTVEPTSLELMIDSGQLEQALINLLRNAAEATADVKNRAVTVNARLTRGSRLRIEISDNGPGVPESLIPHIFTPFFTTKTKGSGIGLAMVRQLVHGNGGTVRYVKAANQGARFILTF